MQSYLPWHAVCNALTCGELNAYKIRNCTVSLLDARFLLYTISSPWLMKIPLISVDLSKFCSVWTKTSILFIPWAVFGPYKKKVLPEFHTFWMQKASVLMLKLADLLGLFKLYWEFPKLLRFFPEFLMITNDFCQQFLNTRDSFYKSWCIFQ